MGSELHGLPDAKRTRCSLEGAGSQRSASIVSPAMNADAAGSSANADGDDKREQQAAAAAIERRLLRNVVLEISMLLRGCCDVPRRAIA